MKRVEIVLESFLAIDIVLIVLRLFSVISYPPVWVLLLPILVPLVIMGLMMFYIFIRLVK
jgi:hypothetical protein